MKRKLRVTLYGGPYDGALMSVETINGKLPRVVNLVASKPFPRVAQFDDGPFPEPGENYIVTYELAHTHPSYGVLPSYRLRPT